MNFSLGVKPKIVLSLDGGGIRGIVSLNLLAEIERRTGKRIAELFDLVAGTSTGAIIGLALNVPHPERAHYPKYSAAQVLEMYLDWGPDIFPAKTWHKIKVLTFLKDEKYPCEGIENTLKKLYGQTKMSESITDLIIPTYDLEMRRPFFFKHFKNISQKGLLDVEFWKAARASSAAPTYFEPFKVNHPNGVGYHALIDGGVFANNPGMVAYAEALSKYKKKRMFMVSIGTGNYLKPYTYEVMKDLSVYKWARPIAEIMMFGGVEVADYQLSRILKPNINYFRLQTSLDHRRADFVDDASPKHMDILMQAGLNAIAENDPKLDAIAAFLTSK